MSIIYTVALPSVTFQMDVGYHRVPDHELQEKIRHHAIGLGIHDFHCNLSDAITNIVSHHSNVSFTPDFKESCTTAGSSKTALRPRHRNSHSTTSFPSSHRVEGRYLHSSSVSDTESKSSCGSGSFTRHVPFSQSARSHSFAHGLLPTILSPPDQQNPFDGCSSAEAMSLDYAENFQPNARTADHGQSLPFPTVSTTKYMYCISSHWIKGYNWTPFQLHRFGLLVIGLVMLGCLQSTK